MTGLSPRELREHSIDDLNALIYVVEEVEKAKRRASRGSQ